MNQFLALKVLNVTFYWTRSDKVLPPRSMNVNTTKCRCIQVDKIYETIIAYLLLRVMSLDGFAVEFTALALVKK